ncbi:MAG: DUF2314 domain-containing protein [Rubripirellula sp.]
MSHQEKSPVLLNAADDPKMLAAIKLARQSFRFFWREASWEQRRIIPGLEISCVKVAFSDPPGQENPDPDVPRVEQMWINDVNFDGKQLTGTLANQPHWLTTVNAGDEVTIAPKQLSDWMYAIGGVAYGGLTINAMRSNMKKGERKEHDTAWGMDFGDPNTVRLVPPEYLGKKPAKKGMFGKGAAGKSQTVAEVAAREHPMAINMKESLEEMLQADPSNATSTDDNGFNILHSLALAGTAVGVAALLKHGADPNTETNNGMTPLKLANSLGWRNVASVLTAAGGR